MSFSNNARDNGGFDDSAAGLSQAEAMQFSEGVSCLLMETEELRRSVVAAVSAPTTTPGATAAGKQKSKVRTRHVVEWQHSLDGLLQHHLDRLIRLTEDTGTRNLEFERSNDIDNLHYDMLHHCQDKVFAVAQQALEASLKIQEPTEDEEADDENEAELEIPWQIILQDGQAAIARITELNLILLDMLSKRPPSQQQQQQSKNQTLFPSPSSGGAPKLKDASSIVQNYVTFQRKVLRLRAKPPIARLVEERQSNAMSLALTESHQQINIPLASSVGNNIVVKVEEEDDDAENDHEDEDQQKKRLPTVQQYHAPVLSAVLGQAAALIHPLLVWQANLPYVVEDEKDDSTINHDDMMVVRALRKLCKQSILTLHEQAETLVKTVLEWFWSDWPILEEYMKQSAEAAGGNNSDDRNSLERDQLGILDALVEELAFICQILARYQALVEGFLLSAATNQGQSTKMENQQMSQISSQILPECAWKYASLERYLAQQQWQAALRLAAPVPTVIGTHICVPSVVEDAQYLSTRALDRAASTLSQQAIGTVAHAVSHDVWSTDHAGTTGGVNQCLIDKLGCWMEPDDATNFLSNKNKSSTNLSSPPKSSGFASALLDALDQDRDPETNSSPLPGRRHAPQSSNAAPSSGNFLTALMKGSGGMMMIGGSGVGGGGGSAMESIQMDTDFCVLNGIHASAGACTSLVALLDSLLMDESTELREEETAEPTNDANHTTESEAPTTAQSKPSTDSKATTMIQLAREELFRYSEAYRRFLKQKIHECLETWCGGIGAADPSGMQKILPFQQLRMFLEKEYYEIVDEQTFAALESDERLEKELLESLKETQFFMKLSDKCEADVLRQIGEETVSTLVYIFLDVFWSMNKRFTDWGSLLLSKQIRLVQEFVSRSLSASSNASKRHSSSASTLVFLQGWERLSQACTVLQLERPSDWLMYNSSDGALTPAEIKRTMSLRVDFSADAVQAVYSQLSKNGSNEGA